MKYDERWERVCCRVFGGPVAQCTMAASMNEAEAAEQR